MDELNQGTEGTAAEQGDTAAQEGGASNLGEPSSALLSGAPGTVDAGNALAGAAGSATAPAIGDAPNAVGTSLAGTAINAAAEGEAGNVQSIPAGSSTAAELPADGAPLVPNDPASGAAAQSEQSTSGTATGASGASDVAALGAEPEVKHPAHTWLDLLETELKTNPFATYARELIAKVRATL